MLSIEPTNKAAHTQVAQTRNKIKLQREKEKKRYANMFDKLASSDEPPEEDQATK